MTKRMLAVFALVLPLLGGLLASATPSSADPADRTCYTPHVAGQNTIEMCIWLPTIQ